MDSFTIKLNETLLPVQITGHAPADNHDYVPFSIAAGKRRATMWVNDMTLPKPAISSEPEAWDYLERVLYPEHDPFYCEGDFFSLVELRQLHRAIIEHHQTRGDHEAE